MTDLDKLDHDGFVGPNLGTSGDGILTADLKMDRVEDPGDSGLGRTISMFSPTSPRVTAPTHGASADASDGLSGSI